MPQFVSAADSKNADIGTGQCLADVDAAIGTAEKEFAADGVLLDVREILPALREKHFS